MAIRQILFPMQSGLPEFYSYYICDTIAELPASGLNIGDLATTLEGPKIYVAINETTWREITKASSSGYAGTGMLGSGTADSTKFLRGDQVWGVPPGGGGPATQIDSEGVTLDIDSIADGQYLKRSGTTVVGDTPSGGGATASTVEVDLGSTPKWCGKFTITDAEITAAKKVLCWQAPGPYTGKGTRADEAELQPVSVICVEPASGSAIVKWQTPPMIIESPLDTRAPNFGGGTAANSGTNRDLQTKAKRIGKVRGNVKFSYVIFA